MIGKPNSSVPKKNFSLFRDPARESALEYFDQPFLQPLPTYSSTSHHHERPLQSKTTSTQSSTKAHDSTRVPSSRISPTPSHASSHAQSSAASSSLGGKEVVQHHETSKKNKTERNGRSPVRTKSMKKLERLLNAKQSTGECQNFAFKETSTESMRQKCPKDHIRNKSPILSQHSSSSIDSNGTSSQGNKADQRRRRFDTPAVRKTKSMRRLQRMLNANPPRENDQISTTKTTN